MRRETITLLMGAAVGLFVGVAGDLAVELITTRQPELRYSVDPREPGPPGTDGFEVVLVNHGDAAVQSVRAVLSVREGVFVGPPRLRARPSAEARLRATSGQTVTVEAPELNPGDTVGIVLDVRRSGRDVPAVEVDARGSGVIGRAGSVEPSPARVWRIAVPACLLAAAALIVVIRRRRRISFASATDLTEIEPEAGTRANDLGRQQRILADIYRRHGMPGEAGRLRRVQALQYWSESDFIAEQAAQDSERLALAESLLRSILGAPSLARGSRQIVMLNIAKVIWRQGRADEARGVVREAISAGVVEERLRSDAELRAILGSPPSPGIDSPGGASS